MLNCQPGEREGGQLNKNSVCLICAMTSQGSSGPSAESDQAVGDTGQAQSRPAGVGVAVQRGVNVARHDDDERRVSSIAVVSGYSLRLFSGATQVVTFLSVTKKKHREEPRSIVVK